jgi:hypothetical protein
VPEAEAAQNRKRVYRCSFCGKSQEEAKTLVAGPGVFICDECVQLCQAIIDKKQETATREVPNLLLPDNAPTEALLRPSTGTTELGRIRPPPPAAPLLLP